MAKNAENSDGTGTTSSLFGGPRNTSMAGSTLNAESSVSALPLGSVIPIKQYQGAASQEQIRTARFYQKQAEMALETYKRTIRKIGEGLFANQKPDEKWREWSQRVLGYVATGQMKAALSILHNQKIIGFCRHCGINLCGERAEPVPQAMPCNLVNCPFERPEKQEHLEAGDLLALVERKMQ